METGKSNIPDYPINDLYDTHTVVSTKFVPKQYKSASDNADWYYENVGKVLLCCGVAHTAICFQKCLHLIGGFCARSSSHKIQSARKKPAVAISVQIVLTYRCRCAQLMNQPVYTVAFVEQLTALLAI